MKTFIRLFVLALTLAAAGLFAQRDRIAGSIEPGQAIRLRGHVRPEAIAKNDIGRAAAALPLTSMKVFVQPSATQQAELERLLQDQRDPSSPDFRKWLTPEQFAERFGLSRSDSARVTSWLASQGFNVDRVARGRMWVEFSGTAGQAEAAFRTEIHRYRVGAETHYANSTEPSIPASLNGIVAAVRGLNDFRPKHAPITPAATLSPRALNGDHQLAPSDLATIYNIKPLYDSGIDGTGQKLAIIGRTRINLSDIQKFRQAFGLPKNDPQLVLAGTDPGITADLIEANLDLEWSGAIAPNATVMYVYSSDVIASAEYAVDQNIAPVMSMSYGECESIGLSGLAVPYRLAAQQANAQGITWMNSSGDSGAAGCDSLGNVATVGLSVNVLASPPEITGVGGTQFNEGSGTYWSLPSASGTGGALSYIPEQVWNETDVNGLIASGGGVSILYTKPAWQTGPGVPDDGMRDVPDISLSAAAGHDAYLVAYNGTIIPIGGTSASSPAFAGIVTLLNHYLLSTKAIPQAGLGNINPNLYRLAQTTPLAFHDIVAGDNMVPCAIGSFDCLAGTFGYKAGPGYDLATGIGTVDANYLVTHWNDQGNTTSMTLTPSAVSMNQSDAITLTATVTAPAGTTPSGAIAFDYHFTPLVTVAASVSGNTAAATITLYGARLSIGSNTIRAVYSGNAKLDGSAATTTVSVSLPASNSNVIPSLPSTVSKLNQPDSHGWSWVFAIQLKETAGIGTTLTDITVDGVSRASQISTIFATPGITPKGTLSGTFGLANLSVPQTVMIGFSGTDASGFKWTQQVPVLFTASQTTALMRLSSVPMTSSDPACPWSQLLTLQEFTGVPVQLTRLLVNSQDVTSQLQPLFGTTRLAFLGQLQAAICRTGATAPAPETFEVDGVDRFFNSPVSAVTTVSYSTAVQNAPQLTVAPDSVIMATNYSSGVATASINVDPGGPDKKWTVSAFPNNANASWLTINPSSGTGPGQVLLYGSASGLPIGTYNTTLIFQAANSTPQSIQIPIAFSRGALNFTTIAGVANAASFTQTFAPGMQISIFGKNLALTTSTVRSTPLPTTLSGVTVTVNGVLAPIYFISSNQLNIQVPYETGSGPAVIGVNNNNGIAAFVFNASAAAPGIFTGANKALVPASTAKVGDTITLFMTGDGDTTVYIANGATPGSRTPLSSLPAPKLPVSVTVAGLTAKIQFMAMTSGLVGATQVNFTIPDGAGVGVQQVVVTVGGVSSAPANVTITQ